MPMNQTYQALIQLTSALSIALKERDVYTRLHSDRVMNLSTEIGEHIGLPSKDLMLLKTTSALHDVGKIGIRDEALLKDGRLDKDELGHEHDPAIFAKFIKLIEKSEFRVC